MGDHRREPSGVHRSSGAFGVFFARGEHPDHSDVAADGEGLQSVAGFTFDLGPDGGTEPDHVVGDPDAEFLGRNEVSDFVQGDGRSDEQHEQRDAQNLQTHNPILSRRPRWGHLWDASRPPQDPG